MSRLSAFKADKWLVSLILFLVVATVLNIVSVSLFSLNFQTKDNSVPFLSDRTVLPFPPLFEEFELDGKNAPESRSVHPRGQEEMCKRRLALEYNSFGYSNGIMQHVNHKSFKVAAHAPTGWLSFTAVDKLVFCILDGMRYDYVINDLDFDYVGQRKLLINLFTAPHEFMSDPNLKNHVRLSKLVAPVPTLTTFAIKVFMSGDTRSTNVIRHNTDPSKLFTDNMGKSLETGKITGAVLGDDIAARMMGSKNVDERYSECAANIYDTDTVENLVMGHYLDMIRKHDFTVLHLANVDHIGHQGRRVSVDMSIYLQKYSSFLKRLKGELEEFPNHLLFVCGDHGHRSNGSHGSGNPEEVETFLLTLSDMELHGRRADIFPKIQHVHHYVNMHSVLNGTRSLPYYVGVETHVNVPTTIALLMNIPIPFNAEGTVISDAVPLFKKPDGTEDEIKSLRLLVQLKHVNAHHLLRHVDLVFKPTKSSHYKHVWLWRKQLVNHYNFIRAMPQDASALNWKPYQLLSVYHGYIELCDVIVSHSRDFIQRCNTILSNEYDSVAIFTQVFTVMLLLYIYTIVVARKGAALSFFKEQDFGNKVLKRLILKLLAAGILTAVAHIEFYRVFIVGPLELTFKWPISITEFLVNWRISLYTYLGLEEAEVWFTVTLSFCFLLVLLALFDTKLLAVGIYKSSHGYRPTNKAPSEYNVHAHNLDEYALRLHNFTKAFSRVNLQGQQLLFYILIGIFSLTSECGIIAHGTLARHFFIILFVSSLLPFAFPVDERSPKFGPFGGFIGLVMLFKASSFFHHYVHPRHRNDLPPKIWLATENFAQMLESSLFALFVFLAALFWVTSKYRKPSMDKFEQLRCEIVNSCRRLWLLKTIWALQFFLSVGNFAASQPSSFFSWEWFHAIIVTLIQGETKTQSLTLMSIYCARALLFVTLVVWTLLYWNPFSLFFDKNVRNRGSSTLAYCIVSGWWLVFICHRFHKAIQTCFAALLFYHLLHCIVSADADPTLGVFITLFALSDVMYFASGHMDRLFDLDFGAAFVLFNYYLGLLSDIWVFFSFAAHSIATAAIATFYCCYKAEYLANDLAKADNGDVTDQDEMELIIHSKRLGFATGAGGYKAPRPSPPSLFTIITPALVGYALFAAVNILAILLILHPLYSSEGLFFEIYTKGLFQTARLAVSVASLFYFCGFCLTMPKGRIKMSSPTGPEC